jgi:hypothetical protein
MIVKAWIWKPIIAGLSGTIVHFVFMYLKSRIGLLPSFQPYHSFQTTLSYWVGANVRARNLDVRTPPHPKTKGR